MELVQLGAIREAQQVITGRLHRTPLLTAHGLGDQLGVELYFKAELFQKTGSFKPRGALNKMHHLSPEEKARGVISISAGNHAAALAFAAAQAGVSATVVMPSTAVKSKIDATRGYGAEVILHGNMSDLLPRMQEIQRERNLTYVPPFDDLQVIAGAGTTGLEILEDVPTPDVVIVSIGGGGLISGVAAAIKQTNPAIKVIGVEPTKSSVMSLSLKQKAPARWATHNTIADGLSAPFAGEHTFAHVREFVDEIVLVTDDEIIAALCLVLERCKVMPEPAAAASFAALLSGKVTVKPGARVVCILSGGNIDRSRLKQIL